MLNLLSGSQAEKVREQYGEHPLYVACSVLFSPRSAGMEGLLCEVEDVFIEAACLIDDLLAAESHSQELAASCWTTVVNDVRHWKADVSQNDRTVVAETVFQICICTLSLHWSSLYSLTVNEMLQETMERETNISGFRRHDAEGRRLTRCAAALNEWINDYTDNDTLLSAEIDTLLNPRNSKKKENAQKTKAFRPTSSTFDYKCRESERYQKLTRFYQDLLKLKWIDSETSPDDVTDLFTNGRTTCLIKWLKSEALLASLFKQLEDGKIITTPQGQTRWNIVRNHFVNSKGQIFSERPTYHAPK